MTYDETGGSGYYEILIGATNRAESAEAKRQLESNRKNHQLDFIITVINEKICIYSGNEEMLQKAVSYFTESFCSSKKAWQRLNTKTRVIYEAPLISYNHKIAGKPLSSFRFVTPRAMEYIYGKEIQSITNHLSNNQGYDLTVTDERDTAVSSEIIVGDTSRAESKAVSVSGDNWVIKETGGKLIIKGGNSLSLAAGIKELDSLIMAGEQSGKGLNIAKGFSKTGKYTPGKGDYRLVWNDEFNGSELNHYWWIDYNNEKYGLQENSSNVLGGKMYNLQTEATAVKNGSFEMYSWRDGKDFYSGKATTNYTMMFRYGIMEIRAKMPEAPGCASIWLNCAGTGYGWAPSLIYLKTSAASPRLRQICTNGAAAVITTPRLTAIQSTAKQSSLHLLISWIKTEPFHPITMYIPLYGTSTRSFKRWTAKFSSPTKCVTATIPSACLIT